MSSSSCRKLHKAKNDEIKICIKCAWFARYEIVLCVNYIVLLLGSEKREKREKVKRVGETDGSITKAIHFHVGAGHFNFILASAK